MEIAAKEAGNQTLSRKKIKNQSIECCRLIASFFVVFGHCKFPGVLGEILDCMARYTVPFFFMVSGYFAYQAGPKVMKRRFWALVKLTVTGVALYALWEVIKVVVIEHNSLQTWLKWKFSFYSFMQSFLINESSLVVVHMWYLAAAIVCHGILWAYACWAEGEKIDYKPLYIVCVCLFAIHLLLSSVATAAGFAVPHQTYRNAWFYGMPMIAMGIFIREYYDKIMSAYSLNGKKLVILVVVGILLSLMQWYGTGKVEVPLATILESVALMLLMLSAPIVTENRLLSRAIASFGSLSVYIYISHVFWRDIYLMHLMKYALRFGEKAETYLYPIVVLGISVATGIVWECGKALLKHMRTGKM